MRDFGPILVLSVLLACGIVAMWRQILTICIIGCIAIIFVGLFGFISAAKSLLSDGSGDQSRSLTASYSCLWAGRSPPSTNLGQTRITTRPASLTNAVGCTP